MLAAEAVTMVSVGLQWTHEELMLHDYVLIKVLKNSWNHTVV